MGMFAPAPGVMMGCKLSRWRCLLNSWALWCRVPMEAPCADRDFNTAVQPVYLLCWSASIQAKRSWSSPRQPCTGTAWGGGGGEACCHEKRATTCYLCSSSPATDFKSQQICRDKKECTFTIHTADRFCVRFRRAPLHWVVHARKAKHLRAHFPGISHAIILVWRKVKNIKNESCGGMCCRETLLCHYHAWQLFRGEAFFFMWKRTLIKSSLNSFLPHLLFVIASCDVSRVHLMRTCVCACALVCLCVWFWKLYD